MHTLLRVALSVISVLLVISILAQSRGAGLSATFGGEGSFFHVKRGPEKVLYFATIILAILFVLTALAIPFVG